VGGIAPSESDVAFAEGNQAMIRDRHTMRVSAEIPKCMLSAAERPLRINHPSGSEQWTKPSGEGFGILERRERSVEAQFALGMQLAQTSHKLAAEHCAQNCHRQEEASMRQLPSCMVGSESAGRNDTVHMRMMQ
jgi:hypothetical protein